MSTAAANPKPKLVAIQPPEKTYRGLRKRIHLICFLIFVALPFFDVMRFDIPRQRFYFAGYELWINEFGIIFFSLMFLMFVVVAMAILYGRIFCGYLCPQMIFSETSWEMEARLKTLVNKKLISWPAKRRQAVARFLFFAAVGIASVFLAFVFTSYFVEPRDLLRRLLSLDIVTAGGITGAVVTLITWLDFTLVRQRFCTTVCPYGYLQGLLVDANSLLVHYRDPAHDCIECKKCVRVCGMKIDIRDSPYQLECVHCGECIDACNEILAKVGKPGLIHYAWGEKGELSGNKAEPWYKRFGMRDPKRIAVALVLLFYLTGLGTALSMRHAVLVRVTAERATSLYRVEPGGEISNRFRLNLANRSSKPARVRFRVEGLPDARLSIADIPLQPAEASETHFTVFARPFSGAREVNRLRIVAVAEPEQTEDVFDVTFLMPPKRSSP